MKALLVSVLAVFLFLTVPHAAHAEGEILTTEKMITVDLGSQLLTAWENGQIQHQTKISSGMWLTPTVKGSFRTYYKTPLQDMKGPSPYKKLYPSGKYLTKNVPHIMYFYQGYAIHGAYWHNSFGSPASHGCVNVPLASAEWLYNWAPQGTRIEIF